VTSMTFSDKLGKCVLINKSSYCTQKL